MNQESNKRAGQIECKVDYVKSIEWKTLYSSGGHGYIDDIFKNDKHLQINILHQLKLKSIQERDEEVIFVFLISMHIF